MWKQDCASGELYCTIANMSKGTQTATDLQAEITIPTSADRTQDTSNSGVYEYDASVFGTATDASNDYPIYYYRGVLENSTAGYGSNGSAVTYPNYVRLGSNSTSSTCWRIVRTTGSGGVKMIYNGTWTGSTCANSTTKAQLSSTSAFNGTSSTYQQAVRVGYMYNSTYASNSTTSRQAGVLFGTNSSYSGNSASSDIKTAIDNWYTSTLKTNYGSKLEPSAGYCGDRTIYNTSNVLQAETTTLAQYSTSTTQYNFGARTRNYTTAQNPTLTCATYNNGTLSVNRDIVDLYTTSDASNGNKMLSNPIALLTADEAAFAGSGNTNGGTQYNAKSFLRSGSAFWLLSPDFRNSGGDTRVFYLGSSGYLNVSSVFDALGVRPAISLNPGAEIASGSGTATDPWVVKPANIPDTPTPIQNLTLATCQKNVGINGNAANVGDTIKTIDLRDGNEYTVRYINGACWMTQNLAYVGDTNSTTSSMIMKATTSNISADQNLPIGDLTSGNSYDTARIHDSDNTSYGVYYNYAAASAGTITSGVSVASYSVCPAGWRLPTYSEFSGITGYSSAFSPVESGYYYNGSPDSAGSLGYWWSATAGSNDGRYSLRYNGSSLASYDSNRRSGFSVRCIRSS